MGIADFKSFLQRTGCTKSIQLSNGTVALDLFEAMYWFAKPALFHGRHNPMDKFGFDYVQYAQLVRSLFRRLAEAGLAPVCVLSGGRPQDELSSELASRRAHLSRSSDISLGTLNRRGSSWHYQVMPPLATNVLKQVMQASLGEARAAGRIAHRPLQCLLESYPVLRDVSRQHACPVLTSHHDYLLMAEHGFVLTPSLNLSAPVSRPAAASQRAEQLLRPLDCQATNLACLLSTGSARHLAGCASALPTLYVLMRRDFMENYGHLVDSLLGFPPNLTARVHEPGRPRARLEHLCHHWPADLTTPTKVRDALAALPNSEQALRDFDVLWQSYSEPLVLRADQSLQGGSVQPLRLERPEALYDALVLRAASAEFLLSIAMHNALYNRILLEDLQLTRSIMSLRDDAYALIMRQLKVPQLIVHDRERSVKVSRTLKARPGPAPDRLTDEHVFEVFSFPEELKSLVRLRQFISDCKPSECPSLLALERPAGEQLLVALMLVRFALERALRDESNEARAQYAPYKEPLVRAIFNVFMFHQTGRLNQHELQTRLVDDANDRSYAPRMRLMCAAMEALLERHTQSNQVGEPGFMQTKHLLEAFSSALQAYMDVNAFAGEPAPQPEPGQWLRAPLVYALVKELRQGAGAKLRSLALELEPGLLQLLGPDCFR